MSGPSGARAAASAAARIAVAGAGLIGQAHIRRIQDDPGAQLAAIIDPSPAARTLATALGVPYFDGLADALRATRPDGVVIATPNQMHVPHGLAAVEAGVPMLLEKPVSTDLASAMRLVAAAEAAGVPILVGHHRRHSPLMRRAHDAVASGSLGRIVAATGLCLFRKPQAYFEGLGAWRRGPGGGVVLINLVHVIDDMRNLCGEVAAVQAVTSSAVRGFAVEDTAAILLHFASGALGTLTASDAAASPWSWEMTSGEDKAFPRTDQSCYLVAGTHGSLSVPRLDTWRHGGDGWWTPLQAMREVGLDQDPLTLQMRHFVQVIRREAAPLLDGHGGTRTLAATLAVAEAARTGGIVRLD